MLNNANNGCTCTPEMRASFECCARCEMSGIFSDVYKDRNGFRPRFHGSWTLAELDEAIRSLYASMEDDEDQAVPPFAPTSGEGWALVTATEPDLIVARLEADYYQG